MAASPEVEFCHAQPKPGGPSRYMVPFVQVWLDIVQATSQFPTHENQLLLLCHGLNVYRGFNAPFGDG